MAYFGGVVVFAITKRVFHLPLDVVLLSIDFIALTRWRVAGWLASSLGVLGPRTGPFCSKRFRTVDACGNSCSLCSHAHRYGNSFVFRFLCPWSRAINMTGIGCVCACSRKSRYRYPSFRYVCLAVSLTTLWSWVAFGMLKLAV